MPLGKSFREVTLSARAPVLCFANLVDAGHPEPIVGHGPDHPSHKGAMPILVLHVSVLPAIREIRAIDVIDDPCMCAFFTSPDRTTDLNPDTCALRISAQTPSRSVMAPVAGCHPGSDVLQRTGGECNECQHFRLPSQHICARVSHTTISRQAGRAVHAQHSRF